MRFDRTLDRASGRRRQEPFRWASLLIALVLSTSPVAGQNADLFFDAVDVSVVNIEVLVSDKAGNPVTGLGREDFVLTEDGEEVELSNFFEVVSGQAVAAPGSPADVSAPPPVPDTQRLQLVVFVDYANLGPQSRARIFDDLRAYLSTELAPEDRVMLVAANDDVEIAQPFTSDPVELLSAVDRLGERLGKQNQLEIEYRTLMRRIEQASTFVPGQTGARAESAFGLDSAVQEAETLARDVGRLAERRFRQVKASAAALERFTDTLAGMKGRKGIVYVSDGLPTRAADSLVEAWIGKYESWMQETNQTQLMRELTSLTSMDFDATRELERLVARANANRVAFYPISAPPRGLNNRISAEVLGSGGDSGPGALAVGVIESFAREASLLQLADGTGGQAFTRSTNISDLLSRMRTDFTNFYSLGYQRPSEEGAAKRGEDGDREHEIRVEVRDRDLEVRYLKSYREKSPMDLLEDRTLTAMHYGVEDNTLGVRLVPGDIVSTGRNRFEVPVLVQIPFQKLLLLPRDASHAAQVTLLVGARDEDGAVSPFQRIDVPIEIPNAQIGQALQGAAGYGITLAMKGGKQRISVGVRDQLARVDSTLNLELLVAENQRATVPGSP